MLELTGEEERLHAAPAAAATDHERVLALDTELRAVRAQREQVEEDWLATPEVAQG